MKVEELTPDAFRAWADMRQALWEDHTEEKDRRQFQEYLAKCEAGQALSFFAVSEDGDRVGFLDAAFRKDHVDGVESPPVWYVEGIFVLPEARGQGVGRFLCSVLERHARSQGYSMIASDCELDDYESEAFHKAIGFKETIRSIHLTKPLDDGIDDQTGFDAESVLWIPVVVRSPKPGDVGWMNDAFERHWSSNTVVIRGRQIDLMATEARLAWTGESRVGVINYILCTFTFR